MCNPRLGALLAAVPRLRVLEMTASVMPERSEPPNLALKRYARAAVSQISYTFCLNGFMHVSPASALLGPLGSRYFFWAQRHITKRPKSFSKCV